MDTSGLQITGSCFVIFCFWPLLTGILIHSCNFDHGLCGWIREKDSDLHWEPVRDPAGKVTLSDTFWYCLILWARKQSKTKSIPVIYIPSSLGEEIWYRSDRLILWDTGSSSGGQTICLKKLGK